MPQNIRIWQVSDTGSLCEISKTRFDSEAKLEEWLETDIGMIGDDLLVIGRGILKKCVNGQAVYPLSEQHGLEARERRYTAHEEGKHWE